MKPNLISILFLTCFIVQLANGGRHKIVQRNLYKNLILEYFKARRVQNAVIFVCWPLNDNVELIKMLSGAAIRASLPSGKQKKSHRELDDLFRIQTTVIGIAFDSCCYDKGAPFFQKYNYFNGSYVWLVLDCGHYRRSLDYLRSLPLLITTDMILTDTPVNPKIINLYDVYNTGYGRDGQFNVTLIGTWSDCQECNMVWKRHFLRSKISSRYDLNGLDIRTVALTENNIHNIDTHTYLSDESEPYMDSLFKMNYQLILLLKKMYNFTISFVMANNWSDKNSKGLYQSGNLLGILAEKKADIMAGSLAPAVDIVEVADILYYTYPFRTGFVFRYQGDFGKTKSSFLAPFNDKVWLSFVFIIIIVILVIWCILLVENKYLTSINRTLWNFSDTILSIIGACCQMGSEVNPVTSASRLAYFFFFFMCLVMYNFYTSSIVSGLLNYRTEKFSLNQLADSPLECGSADTGYAHYLLFDNVQSDHSMNYFNVRKKNDEFYLPVEEGIRYVKEGGFAYHAEYNSIYTIIENTFKPREICELEEIDTIQLADMAIFGMKNSPYTEMFRLGLNKAGESGHLKRLKLIWVARKPECQASKNFIEVSLHQVTPSHVVLYAGIGFAILVFLFERKKWQDYVGKLSRKNFNITSRKY